MLLSSLIEANELEQAVAESPLIVTADTLATEAIALMSNARGSCSLVESKINHKQHILNECRASCVLVAEQDKVIGIFTERDVVRLSSEGGKVAGLKITDVMTRDVITINKSDFTDIFVVLNIFQRYLIRHLPIIDEQGKVSGIITYESLWQLLRPIDLLRLRVIAEVMTLKTFKAAPDSNVINITQIMARENVSSVIIVEQRNSLQIPIGIITERDIVQFQALGLDLENIHAQTVLGR
ncbi:MAG: CBS domain-containing protein [Sphaerospermopsis sp. SIO1G2]|nr:CBS domain-containing protein [Sphaerospermopsis sp. SIO1G2]